MSQDRRGREFHRHRAGRGGESERARFERRQAETNLQQQRQQERDRADAEPKQKAADDRGHEGLRLQETEVEDRVGVAARVSDVEREQRRPAQHHRDDDRRGRKTAPDHGQSEDEAQQPRPRQSEALEVETRDIALPNVFDELQRQQDAEQADWRIYPENPTPVEIGGDEAAERRPDYRADQRGHGEIGERVDHFGFGDAAQQHQPPDRHHHRPAEALKYAGRDQRRQRRRRAAEDRAERKDYDRRAEHRAGAELVGDP